MALNLCIHAGEYPAVYPVFSKTGTFLNSEFLRIKFMKIKLYCTELIFGVFIKPSHAFFLRNICSLHMINGCQSDAPALS